MKPKNLTEELMGVEHGWTERRDGHPQDITLRRNKFKIHSRPKSGSALWQKGNKVYTEQEALAMCGAR